MYTLLYGLYKYLVQKDEYFILILGLDNAGKTVRTSQTCCCVILQYLKFLSSDYYKNV